MILSRSRSSLFHQLVPRGSGLIVQPCRYKSCGLVGLPNVGKSLVFNALTQSQLAASSNFPFTTIEPNTAVVEVKDKILIALRQLAQSKRIVFTTAQFVDIAGLIEGASKGAGLGSQFLSNIRNVDVILHVLRCFDDEDIVHVNSKVDPVADMEIVETELMLADAEMLDKRLEKAQRKKSSGTAQDLLRIGVIEKCLSALNAGIQILDCRFNKDEQNIVDQLQLITAKPTALLLNVDESSIANGNPHCQRLMEHVEQLNNSYSCQQSAPIPGVTIKRTPRPLVRVCAALENDAITGFDTDESRREYFASFNLCDTSLDQVIRTTSDMLKQSYFYTVGPEEAHAWLIPSECEAVTAAGKIHSDIEHGFVNAEIISAVDFLACGGEDGAKKAGKVKIEGRAYRMKQGDIANFRFNKTKAHK